jgi:hypothetical protein
MIKSINAMLTERKRGESESERERVLGTILHNGGSGEPPAGRLGMAIQRSSKAQDRRKGLQCLQHGHIMH